MHTFRKTTRNTEARGAAVPLPCACASLRRAARVVTQFYDDALLHTGLRVTQFTLLQALRLAKAIAQKDLAGLLKIDRTPLSRPLALLRRKSWLNLQSGADRREV